MENNEEQEKAANRRFKIDSISMLITIWVIALIFHFESKSWVLFIELPFIFVAWYWLAYRFKKRWGYFPWRKIEESKNQEG